MSIATAQIPDPIVQCDHCRGGFRQQPCKYVERDGDIEMVGLQCPNCGARHVAYRTDGRIRMLQAKVRKETERFRAKIVAGVPPNRAERKLRQAKRELEQAFKALNAGG